MFLKLTKSSDFWRSVIRAIIPTGADQIQISSFQNEKRGKQSTPSMKPKFLELIIIEQL